MQSNVMKIRMLAGAGAVAVVAGAMLTLGSYSNAKFEVAAAAARPQYTAEPLQLAIEPSRIHVVATRLAGTRTATQLIEASVPRPQS